MRQAVSGQSRIPSWLFLLCSLLLSHLSLADQSFSKDVFAKVNGMPLHYDLYHFLLGSRLREQSDFPDQDDFDRALNRQQASKDLIMTEVLSQVATQAGIADRAEVRVELEMARKTLLAQLYVQELMASFIIDEADIKAHYDQQAPAYMYRFMIWRQHDQKQAQALLDTLRSDTLSDADKARLRQQAIETPWLRDTDIEAQVNDLLKPLPVNQFVNTPLLQDGVWKVIQLIDKDEIKKQSYELERELIRAELVRLKLEDELARLSKSATIEFNPIHVKEMN